MSEPSNGRPSDGRRRPRPTLEAGGDFVPFASVPYWLLEHPDLTIAALRLWGALWRLVDWRSEEKVAWPTKAKLEAATGLTRTGLRRAVATLESVGALDRMVDSDAAGRRHAGAHYRLNWGGTRGRKAAPGGGRKAGPGGCAQDDPPRVDETEQNRVVSVDPGGPAIPPSERRDQSVSPYGEPPAGSEPGAVGAPKPFDVAQIWKAAWREHRGADWAMDGASWAAAKRVLSLAEGDLDEIAARAQVLLSNPDRWTFDNASLALLGSRWNQCGVRAPRPVDPRNLPRGAESLRPAFEVTSVDEARRLSAAFEALSLSESERRARRVANGTPRPQLGRVDPGASQGPSRARGPDGPREAS